jgi:hypothetical protein
MIKNFDRHRETVERGDARCHEASRVVWRGQKWSPWIAHAGDVEPAKIPLAADA